MTGCLAGDSFVFLPETASSVHVVGMHMQPAVIVGIRIGWSGYLTAIRLYSLSEPWFVMFGGQLQRVALAVQLALPTGVKMRCPAWAA